MDENVATPIYLGEVNEVDSNDSDFWSADVNVNHHRTEFKLDTGSKICVVGSSTPWMKDLPLTDTNIQFRGPGGVSLNHLIVKILPRAQLKAWKCTHHEDIYAMRNQAKNLLSKSAIQALELLRPASTVYAVESNSDFKTEFPELFKGLGLLKDPPKRNMMSKREEGRRGYEMLG